MRKLLFVGSNSIHCQRYIAGLLELNQFEIVVITNKKMEQFASLIQYELNFALHSLKTAKQILKYVNEFNPEIIHIQQANSYAWHTFRAVAKLKTGKPKIILTTWGSDVLILPNQSKLMHKIVRYSLVNADVITADSFNMLSRISEILGDVSRPSYNINFGIKNIPREALSVQNKQKFILSNRLHKKLYRVDKIISAFAELYHSKRIDSEYKLIVAAAGSETESLQGLVQELNISAQVEFVGMLSYEQLVVLYQRATVFLSVPESDGTASSLLEAMAYGCIPVLSNLPANLEWVLDGVNGFIAPNLVTLSEQILNALMLAQNQIEHQKVVEFNYQLIKQKALFENNIQKFIDLY